MVFLNTRFHKFGFFKNGLVLKIYRFIYCLVFFTKIFIYCLVFKIFKFAK